MEIGVLLAALMLGIFVLALCGIGAKLTWSAVRHMRLAFACTRWPTVAVEIEFTQIQEQVDENTETNRRTWYYQPEVNYRYQVGDHGYTSSQRVFGDKPRYDSRERARAIIEKYPQGQTARVYYNPANPRQAVLEPGKIGALFGPFFGGIICLGVAWMLFQFTMMILKIK